MTDVSLAAVNAALFEQLQVLRNPNLKGDRLKEEIDRTKGITSISGAIARNGDLMLKAVRLDETTAASSIMDNRTAALLCLDN